MDKTYNYIDLTPKGRDEAEIGGMGWVRHHDRYGEANFVHPWAERPGITAGRAAAVGARSEEHGAGSEKQEGGNASTNRTNAMRCCRSEGEPTRFDAKSDVPATLILDGPRRIAAVIRWAIPIMTLALRPEVPDVRGRLRRPLHWHRPLPLHRCGHAGLRRCIVLSVAALGYLLFRTASRALARGARGSRRRQSQLGDSETNGRSGQGVFIER